jgi:hypothetical protein
MQPICNQCEDTVVLAGQAANAIGLANGHHVLELVVGGARLKLLYVRKKAEKAEQILTLNPRDASLIAGFEKVLEGFLVGRIRLRLLADPQFSR